jgi:hypothetical protein
LGLAAEVVVLLLEPVVIPALDPQHFIAVELRVLVEGEAVAAERAEATVQVAHLR